MLKKIAFKPPVNAKLTKSKKKKKQEIMLLLVVQNVLSIRTYSITTRILYIPTQIWYL